MIPVVFKTHLKCHNRYVVTGDFLIDVDVTLEQACHFEDVLGQTCILT